MMDVHYRYQLQARQHQKEMLAEAQKARLIKAIRQATGSPEGIYQSVRLSAGRYLIAVGEQLVARAESNPVGLPRVIEGEA